MYVKINCNDLGYYRSKFGEKSFVTFSLYDQYVAYRPVNNLYISHLDCII
jgi:hypothetical protein